MKDGGWSSAIYAAAGLACLGLAAGGGWLPADVLRLALSGAASMAGLAFGALVILTRHRARRQAAISTLLERLESGGAAFPEGDDPAIRALALAIAGRLSAAAAALSQTQEQHAGAQAQARDETEAREAEARARRDALTALTEALKAFAGGDLTVRLGGALPPEAAPAGQKFDQAVTRVTKALLAFATSLGAIRSQSRDITKRARRIADRGEGRAQTMADISKSLRSKAQSLQAEKDLAEATRSSLSGSAATIAAGVGGAKAGGAALENFIAVSGRIAEITTLIDEVSFQTNLLALNAGVEAARAGDAGRGIAVVAQELRGLAARSTGAAKELSAILSTALRDARTSAGGVQEAGRALEALATKADAAAQFAASTGAASARRAEELANFARELEGLAAQSEQDRGLSAEASEAGASLEELLGKLAGLVAHFRFEHDDFGFDDEPPAEPNAPPEPPRQPRLPTRRPALAIADRRRAAI